MKNHICNWELPNSQKAATNHAANASSTPWKYISKKHNFKIKKIQVKVESMIPVCLNRIQVPIVSIEVADLRETHFKQMSHSTCL